MRAAIYARVSTVGQDPQLQLDAARSWCHAQGWSFTEYVDVGVSGAKSSRPQLDAMMDAIGQGKIDVLVCWRLDRLGRSVQHLLDLLVECQTNDVQLVSVTEAIDTTTPMGRMVYTLLAAFAQLEREIIIERVNAGLAAAKVHGTRSGRAIGRPKADVDLGAAETLLASGRTMTDVARILGVGVRTLQRAFAARQNP